MPSWLAIPLLVAVNLLLGALLLSHFTGARRPGSDDPPFLSPLEFTFAALALGISLTGWLALLLAEWGYFSLLSLALLLLPLFLVLLAIAYYRRGLADFRTVFNRLWKRNWRDPSTLLLLLWLPVAGWLFFRPHQFVQGGADAGVYVNLAASISHTGGILIEDPVLARLDASLYPALLRPLPPPEYTPYYLLPGFYVNGGPEGEIVPQFYPLHPVWQAVAYGLAGTDGALLMTGLWALLGVLAVYLAVRTFSGWATAALVLTALSLNAIQVWFARYPTTEMLTQYLLWTGIWSLGLWLDNRRPASLWALLAGLTLGQTFLVRIDTFFLLAIPVAVFLWRLASGRLRRADGWFFVPFGLMVLHSLAHAVLQSAPYFYNTFGYVITMLRFFWWIPLLGALLLAGFLWLLLLFRRRWTALARYRRPALIAATLVILLLAAYGAFLRPQLADLAGYTSWYDGRFIPGTDAQNIPRLAWYLSPLGLALAVAGSCLLLWHTNRRNVMLLGVGLFFAILYLWRIQANPQQIYSMRRYVPAVMPFAIVAAAYLIGWFLARPSLPPRLLGLILALVWLANLGWLARGFVSQVDYAGLPGQLAQLNARFEPDSILLFNDAAPVGQADKLGTPLRFLHRQPVFILRDPAALQPDLFAQALQNWQSEARSIYWLAVPGGNDWPLPQWELQLIGTYSIQTEALEGPVERRPTAVIPIEWSGEIYRVQSR